MRLLTPLSPAPLTALLLNDFSISSIRTTHLPMLSIVLIISRMFFSLSPTREPKTLPKSKENRGQPNSFAIALHTRLFSVVILQVFYPVVLYLFFGIAQHIFSPRRGVEASWGDYIFSLPMRCGWRSFAAPSPLIGISAFQIFSSIFINRLLY